MPPPVASLPVHVRSRRTVPPAGGVPGGPALARGASAGGVDAPVRSHRAASGAGRSPGGAGGRPPGDTALSDYITLSTVGLALGIVGVIFLTNSMVVRKPRRFIQQYFGVERPQPLRAVLGQLNAKAQIFTGFVALLIGFSLQIADAINPPAPAPVVAPPVGERVVALGLLGFCILTVTVLLRVAQNAWSVATMRRMLAEFFEDHGDWNFEKHPNQTREIGELLGVPAREDDSIEDYAARVRSRLDLDREDRGSLSADDAFAPVRKLGADRRH